MEFKKIYSFWLFWAFVFIDVARRIISLKSRSGLDFYELLGIILGSLVTMTFLFFIIFIVVKVFSKIFPK